MRRRLRWLGRAVTGCAVLLLLVACTGAPRPAPPPQDREALYERCESEAPEGHPDCYTKEFGMNRRAADESLEGLDVGPGGLQEVTATEDGFPAGSAITGTTIDFVNSGLTVNISQVLISAGDCRVLHDPEVRLSVVTDPDDVVQAFLIANPVVKTREGIQPIGLSLEELQNLYPLEVRDFDGGTIGFIIYANYLSHYDERVEPSRTMAFVAAPDGIIRLWVVGASSHVAAVMTNTACTG